jgi:hypothetical protein
MGACPVGVNHDQLHRARAGSADLDGSGRGDVLRSRPLVTGDSGRGIRSCPAAAHLECGPIARDPGEPGRGSTGDLGPCRPGPRPAEPPRGSASVKAAQVKGNPEGNRREPAPGNGRRERTGERRTKGNQRKHAGRRETTGRRAKGRTRRANGKPEESPPGTPEAVRTGPKPPGESPGIWGRTHLRCRWRSPGIAPGQHDSHRLISRPPDQPALRMPAGGWPGLRRVCRGSGGISPPYREAGSMCQRGGMPTRSRGFAVRSPRRAGSGSRTGAARR